MNNIKIFENKEFGEIRTVEVGGKFYAVGVDVARALDYSNPSKAVTDHCKGDFLSWEVRDATGKMQKTRLIPEGDVYRLTIKASEQSQNKEIKEKACKFEKWIFDEILPSIRKTGKYESGQRVAGEQIPIGEVASYLKAMDRTAVRQDLAPYKIAENFKKVSEQFGIRLTEDFVKTPEFEQMSMWDFGKAGEGA